MEASTVDIGTIAMITSTIVPVVGMLLCYSYGYSHSEISSITELPLGTVKSHIKRSTEKIRHAFNIEV